MKLDGQKGSALFIILLAIIVFAAFYYAITQTSRHTGNVEDEKGSILASEILSYGSSISSAITRVMLLNGCDISEVSFENAFEGTLYANANAPANKKCHIFDPAGGGVVWRKGPPSIRYDTNIGQYKFRTNNSGSAAVRGVGTNTKGDLYMAIWARPGYSKTDNLVDACKWLNKQSGINTIPSGVTTGYFGTTFTGVFYDGSSQTISHIPGKTAVCSSWSIYAPLLLYTLYVR